MPYMVYLNDMYQYDTNQNDINGMNLYLTFM